MSARILGITILIILSSTSNVAYAIPSPELIIGSVSSFSQIVAVLLGTITAFGAMIANRLGFARKTKSKRTYPIKLLVFGFFTIIGLIGLNIFQYYSTKTAEQSRLQATLFRPASFDGTKINDENLKETSFKAQTVSQFAMSTEEASALISSQAGNEEFGFFDIRERSEFMMGSLPGAVHERFPDFLASNLAASKKSVLLFCHNGNRSSETCAELAKRGIDCRFIAGGIEKWIVEGRAFSDQKVTNLGDLRAIPNFENKDKLLSTSEFTELYKGSDIQIVDARYPGDFATGHLPNAVNIPIRALQTSVLQTKLSALENKPTVVACYDRRSCFMGQVIAHELSLLGIPFLGRYTNPWEFFIPKAPKPHVEAWLNEAQKSLWAKSVDWLAAKFTQLGQWIGFLSVIFLFALASRLLVLPVALKSERDQALIKKNKAVLDALKRKTKGDPIRKSRAIARFYKENNITPGRNMLALLFLPLMMVGLSAIELASKNFTIALFWVENIALPDPIYIWPIIVAGLGCLYLDRALVTSNRGRIMAWILGGIGLTLLTAFLSSAGNIYLFFAISFLLIQRSISTGEFMEFSRNAYQRVQIWKTMFLQNGIFPLTTAAGLSEIGNKTKRLSIIRNLGLPVPNGAVLPAKTLKRFNEFDTKAQRNFSEHVWKSSGTGPYAVRSSASGEDSADFSFAGVFDSVLDVGKDRMHSALSTVLASFTSDRSDSYQNAAVLGQGNILIQEMVNADYAGVMFTKDPSNPAASLVEYVKGCGDDLVSGRKTPKSIQIGRFSGDVIGKGTHPFDVSELAMLGRKIENIFDHPQDIEWVYANGKFEIVQTRDITIFSDQPKAKEWVRIFDRFKGSAPDEVILTQDELSEVMPRSTPLSFSLMEEVWRPGGAVDRSCRALNIGFSAPEFPKTHLMRVFGRTFSDIKMKEERAIRLTDGQLKSVKKIMVEQSENFARTIPNEVTKQLDKLKAVDFSKNSLERNVFTLKKLTKFMLLRVFPEVERVNILASIAVTQAEGQRPDGTAHPHLPNAPSSFLANLKSSTKSGRRKEYLDEYGHRSTEEYELSCPRFADAPEMTDFLLEIEPFEAKVKTNFDLNDPYELSLFYQNQKELAKNEVLKLYAEMRRIILALGSQINLEEEIFYLSFKDVKKLSQHTAHDLAQKARKAFQEEANWGSLPQLKSQLTLKDLEATSLAIESRADSKRPLSGTPVSFGPAIHARIFKVDANKPSLREVFEGFEEGDILVCEMLNPIWLPYMVKASAVLTEVGGQLSHMAIVAREKKIPMLVNCAGLDTLKTGAMLTLHETGELGERHAKKSKVA